MYNMLINNDNNFLQRRRILTQLQRLSADIILPITQLRFWRFRVGTTDFLGGGSEA